MKQLKMERIINKLNELKEYYDLKDRHILIIKSLKDNDLSADKISEKTDIPKGRIYDFINELLEVGLIAKTNTSPALFSIKNLSDCIHTFLNYKFDDVVKSHIKMYNILEEKQDNPKINYFMGGSLFIREVLDLLTTTDSLKIMCMKDKVPFFLYPFSKKEFKKAREIIAKNRGLFTGKADSSYPLYEGYFNFLKRDKELTYLTDEISVKKHFEILKRGIGEVMFKDFLLQLEENLTKFNLRIFLVNNPFYYHLHLTSQKIVMNIVSDKTNMGVSIKSHRVAKVYDDLYESYLQSGLSILDYLKTNRSKLA